MVFCEFLALCWESYGTGILAKLINERYTKLRLYIFFHSFLFFLQKLSLTSTERLQLQLPPTSPSQAN